MTELLERTLKTVRTLPDEVQDEIARAAQAIAEDHAATERGEVYRFVPGEWESLQEGLRQAERGEFATEEEIEALWAKYGA